MKEHPSTFNKIHSEGDWSLFLDRDGVINRRISGGYVLVPEELEIFEDVPIAIRLLSKFFKYIFIVTNQQCIGKGLLTMQGVEEIHDEMISVIDPGRTIITEIFISPHLTEDNNEFRKPGIGMAKEAIKLYRDVDLSKSVMAGDSVSDLLFGRNAGMINILIGSYPPEDKSLYDYNFESLFQFAHQLQGYLL